MDANGGYDSDSSSNSPLTDDFECNLIREFEGKWLYEDDQKIRVCVDQLFGLFYDSRELFYKAGRDNDAMWLDDPTPLQVEGSAEIYSRTHSIFDKEIKGHPESLIERARQICGLNRNGEKFSDGQIFATLALSVLARAIGSIADVCKLFQTEVEPVFSPLSVLREMGAPEYWQETNALRTRNWREEQDKFNRAYKYRAQANTMMNLAMIASEGVMPHRVDDFASKILREGIEHGKEIGRNEGPRKGKKDEHTEAIETLARTWQLFTPAKFKDKLFGAKKSGNFYCDATGGKLSRFISDCDALYYQPAGGGKPHRIAADALKKALSRSKPKL